MNQTPPKDSYRKRKNIYPLRSQERPLGFLKGHGGDEALPEKLGG